MSTLALSADGWPGRRTGLVVLFAIALTLRLGLALWQGIAAPPDDGSDEQEYVTYALNLARHGEYRGMSPDIADQNHLTAYRTPGTSLLYAAVFSLFGQRFAAVRVVNSVLGAFSCILITVIGRRVFDARVGLMAGWGWAFYPRALFFSVSLLSESLGLTTFLAFLLAALTAVETRRVSLYVIAGVWLGIAVLVHPSRAFLAPMVPLWAIAMSWRHPVGIKKALIIPVCAVLTLLPWTVRNYLTLHAFIPLSTSGGSALLQGNNRLIVTDPSLVGYSIWDTSIPEYRESLRSAGNEIDRDALAGRFATEWIRANAELMPELVLRKLQRGFTPFLQPQTATMYRLLELLAWGPVLMLTLLGVWPISLEMVRRQNPGWLLHLSVLHVVAVTIIFFGNSRYRYPVEPIFLLFASVTLVGLRVSLLGLRTAKNEQIIDPELKSGRPD